jgi:tetratricopeptide (TPR) repeat protein
MKKILILLTMIMAFGVVNAQKSKRTSAYNYWNDGKLDKAKENIDLTILDPSTMNDAKTWMYRGNIYLDIHRSAKPEFKSLAPDALSIAYDSYKKATELDTKKEFQPQIMISMLTIGEQLYNEGATLFQASDFVKAGESFEKAISVTQAENNTDTMAIYGAALSFEGAKEFPKAITYYEKLIELKVKNPLLYSSLANIYSEQKQIDKAEAVLVEGRKLYPDDFNLIISQSNLYLQQNNPSKALESLSLAREKDPTNKSIVFAIGVTYDMLRADSTKSIENRQTYFEKATVAYKDAIVLDSNYFDAIFNLGALYFNKGGDIINFANKLPLGDKNYDAKVIEGNDHLKMALPYLEKASKMHPDDMNAIVSLKEIYTRLSMFDKLKEVNTLLQNK